MARTINFQVTSTEGKVSVYFTKFDDIDRLCEEIHAASDGKEEVLALEKISESDCESADFQVLVAMADLADSDGSIGRTLEHVVRKAFEAGRNFERSRMAPEPQKTERLPLTVQSVVLKKVISANTPADAARIIVAFKPEDAVSIIDNLDPLTAAFAVTAIRLQGRIGGGSQKAHAKRKHIAEILELGTKLNIRGMNGLCDARDQVYRETGYFAGT